MSLALELSHIRSSHATPRALRDEVVALKDLKGLKDCKPRALAKPGGQEFDIVPVKDFFKSCPKVRRCLMSASKAATHRTEKKLWCFVL